MALNPLVKKAVAEFLGTYVLVFSVGANIVAGTPYFGVLSVASTLMVMIYALAKVSGAHFNPAVTAAVAVVKEDFTWIAAAVYVSSQLVGGIAAAFTYYLLFGKTFSVTPVGEYSWVEAASVEFHYTAFLVFCVLNTALATANKGNEYYGLTIGFSVVAGGYACAKISGGFLNPAIVLANDIVSHKSGFGYSLLYTAFQVLGGGAAAGLYRVVRAEEFGGVAQTLVAKLISEFIGTYILVLTVGLNVLAPATADKAQAVLSIAAALTCGIYALGSVSGAHFNPAVTLAVCLRKKMDWAEGGYYVATQLFAGVLAGISFGLITNNGFPLGPHDSVDWWNIAIAEGLFTFVLAFVVLATVTTRSPLQQFFGIAIGFCIIVGGYSIGGISGGHLNPAVSFGVGTARAIFDKGNFMNALIYSVAQLAGGALAAVVFFVTHDDDLEEHESSPSTLPRSDVPRFSESMKKYHSF
eukprot:gene312-1138_t